MAFAPGKILLFGEHAVVHGEPAIAAVLSTGVHARIVPGTGELEAPAWGLQTRSGAQDRPAQAWTALCEAMGTDASQWRVDLETELPAGAGLGSSAAMSVAIARALQDVGACASDDALVEAVWAAERVFHGNPSGLDHTVILEGRPVFYRRFPQQGRASHLEPVALRHPLSLVVVQVAPGADTSEMVGGVQARLTREPARMGAVLEDIGVRVSEAVAALEAGDLAWIGRLMQENHTLLQALGVSTPELDATCARAMAAGALGAKLTGAGGGGCVLVLARDPEHAEALDATLRPHALRTLVTSLSTPEGG